MGTPQYVVTRNGNPSSNPSVLDFGPSVGRLHKLEVDKNFHVYYVPVAEGKVGELAKLAEELNAAGEREAMAERVEVKEDPEASVGIPTQGDPGPTDGTSYMRPGWEPMWILQELNQALTLASEGKINLVDFKKRIAKIKEQMMEDTPK